MGVCGELVVPLAFCLARAGPPLRKAQDGAARGRGTSAAGSTTTNYGLDATAIEVARQNARAGEMAAASGQRDGWACDGAATWAEGVRAWCGVVPCRAVQCSGGMARGLIERGTMGVQRLVGVADRCESWGRRCVEQIQRSQRRRAASGGRAQLPAQQRRGEAAMWW
jgi:hypothetical protein